PRSTPTIPVVTEAAPDSLQGRVLLGRYRIGQRIARGGMGSVFLAREIETGERFAVKALHPAIALEPRVRERFLNEARAARRISHPAVVRVIDVGEIPGGAAFLVMEFVDGTPLRRLLKRGPVPEPRAVAIARSLAAGLDAAHRVGVIHRDLKPENVLIPRPGGADVAARLVDFGIARIVDAPRLTTTRHVMGTPQYISPEQAMGAPIDGRADIYALGVMLYEMLAGALPFDDEDPEALLRKHIKATPISISAGAAPRRVDPALERLVMRCLEKSPRLRPADMSEVLAALDASGG
ncbi:MAG TPA: serine/threonine-protein kinase, partial [Polyangia bacterium]|nr:serine/threonine-protein kinase [Polyangia bacterium]